MDPPSLLQQAYSPAHGAVSVSLPDSLPCLSRLSRVRILQPRRPTSCHQPPQPPQCICSTWGGLAARSEPTTLSRHSSEKSSSSSRPSPPKSPPPPGAPPASWYTLEMIGEHVSCTSLSFSSKSSFSASWLSSSHSLTSSSAFSIVSLSSSRILSATPFSESPSVFFIE